MVISMTSPDGTNPCGNGEAGTQVRLRLSHGVSKRVDLVRGSESITSFAATIGIHKENLRRVLKAGQSPGLELVMAVCQRYDINANWLLFGIEPIRGRDQVALLYKSIDGVASEFCSPITEAGGFMPEPSSSTNGRVNRVDLTGGTHDVGTGSIAGPSA